MVNGFSVTRGMYVKEVGTFKKRAENAICRFSTVDTTKDYFLKMKMF